MDSMFSTIFILSRRFLLALVFAAICRLLFLFFNPSLLNFPTYQLFESFFFGLSYDISALVYIHAIFIGFHIFPSKKFYQTNFQQYLLILYMLGQFVFFFFNLVDTGFYPISGRRSGSEIFDMAFETNGLVLKYLSSYWYLFILLLVLTLLNYFAYKRVACVPSKFLVQTNNKFLSIFIKVAALFLVFIGGRGGLKLIPLNPFDAAKNTRAELIPLVVNTPFNIIISAKQPALSNKNFFSSKEELTALFNPIRQLTINKKTQPPRNIVLLIVESLGKEYVGFYNNGKGFTPFLDSLMQHSEVYMHAYANGKKSIEGLPAILSGLPSLMQMPYLSSIYQNNMIRGAGHYLQEIGYSAAFYHGGKNGTMSFDNYIALSNGGAYFGKNEYPNQADFDGYWGVSDRPYLQYVAQEISKQKAPTFTTVFTLTSHHPYQLPEKEKQRFKEGTLPIHKTISYADDALRDFFLTASKEDWFAHTTFIITADHSAVNEMPYYQTPQGKFEIPLLVYRPKVALPKKLSQTVSQSDILQIILSEAQYNKPFFSFGSGLNTDSNACAVQFQDGYYQVIQWPFVLNFENENAIALYQLEQDSLMKINLLKNPNYALKIESLSERAKAIIQSYNERIIANKTY